jgi:hypothetical protein
MTQCSACISSYGVNFTDGKCQLCTTILQCINCTNLTQCSECIPTYGVSFVDGKCYSC